MAVSIDRVYQNVLAFANNEQRGYITPQEFNLFADQAQMEIFEQYFYDINQWSRQHGNDTGHSDMLDILENKVSAFESWASNPNTYVFDSFGNIDLFANFPNFYKLVEVRVNYDDGFGYRVAEETTVKEFRKYNMSPLTQISNKYPYYIHYFDGFDRIKIFPYPPSSNLLTNGDFSDDSDWILSPPGSYSAGTPWIIGNGIAQGGQGGDQGYMEIPVPEIVEGRTYRITYDVVVAGLSGSLILANHAASSANVPLTGEHTVGTYSVDWVQGPQNIGKIELYNDSNFDGAIDNVSVSYVPVTSFRASNVKTSYIKKPTTPNWSYIVVNNKPLYNSTPSTNFELHPSEESELVYRILTFAGIAIEKPQLSQLAGGL